MNDYKLYLNRLYIVLFCKLLIIYLLPLTGDEAYFIKWANNLDIGYYDHPPMVGWMIYLLSFINDSYVFFRLFSFFTTIIIAFVIYKIGIMYEVKKEKAFFVSLIFLISPIDILILLMTNDVTLVFFALLGTLFLLQSYEQKGKWFFYTILSGVFLGFAFLSKYFAVFLFISLLFFSFIVYKTRILKNVVIVTIVISLFIFENLYFNYNNCWNNIIFNFFARTSENNEYSLITLSLFYSFVVYLITPWGLYYILKAKYPKEYLKDKLIVLIVSVLIISFIVFTIVGLKNKVGLHWLLVFIPFIYLLYSYVDIEKLKKIFRYSYYFTFAHIILLMGIIVMPKSLFEHHKEYSNIILFTQTDALCKVIQPYSDEQLFTTGYTSASILSYHCNRNTKMLFNNSKYGRMDDKLFDVRFLSGKNIVLFESKKFNINQFTNVCKDGFIQKEIKIEKAKFYLAQCNGFDYSNYKNDYLDIQKEKFYSIPDWLPYGKCYFLDRYYR